MPGAREPSGEPSGICVFLSFISMTFQALERSALGPGRARAELVGGTERLRRDPTGSAKTAPAGGAGVRPVALDLREGSPGSHSFLSFDLRRLQTLGGEALGSGDASPLSSLHSSASTPPIPPRAPRRCLRPLVSASPPQPFAGTFEPKETRVPPVFGARPFPRCWAQLRGGARTGGVTCVPSAHAF